MNTHKIHIRINIHMYIYIFITGAPYNCALALESVARVHCGTRLPAHAQPVTHVPHYLHNTPISGKKII